ncbi:hypothetical protein TNCV_1239951 [Trichonephila clavipes]|nr:hypothetical protein TNCV_1239951 [Trichonephila clavipes]
MVIEERDVRGHSMGKAFSATSAARICSKAHLQGWRPTMRQEQDRLDAFPIVNHVNHFTHLQTRGQSR